MGLDIRNIIPVLIDTPITQGRVPTEQDAKSFAKETIKAGLNKVNPLILPALNRTGSTANAKKMAQLLLNKSGYFAGQAARQILNGR
jgi:hypothetical protein